MQNIVNDTHNKKKSCNNMYAFTLRFLCTTILKVDWQMIVNMQCLKEAKTKQSDIKLLCQIVRKGGMKRFFFVIK